jgi:hypothetical protein
MASLLKTADSDPALPEALRADHLSQFDKPAKQRRPRPSAAAAQAEVEALLGTDPDAAAAALARYVDRLAGNAGFLLWASQAFSELADRRPSRGLPDRTLATDAWATLLCTVVVPPGDDDLGLQLIDRLDKLHALNQRFDPPLDYQEQVDSALQSFAASGPRSALAAANLLTATNPTLALQLAEASDDSLGRVLVCATAHCELGQFEPAAHQFDRLERWGHDALELNLDDRFAWVLAMTEVGRFDEAERVCGETLGRLRLLRNAMRAGLGVDAGRDDDPTGHWAHVYCIQSGRLAHLQGRFTEGWDFFRDASDDDATSPPLRRSALRLRLMLADRAGAAAALRELEAIADRDRDPEASSAFVDAALWAAGQWGVETVAADDVDGLYLRSARLRGQTAARALLARSGDDLDLGPKLRLALLAGDDRLAERLLGEPLSSDEPWWTRVLAAVLALRTGRDGDASTMLEEVLTTRRHDMDLRVLQAQAALFSGDHRGALTDALACTAAMPDHLLARVLKAECEFESALARGATSDADDRSAESAQQLIQAALDYRAAADLHLSTRRYLETGTSDGPVGSEPLSPRLFEEVCRRGVHASITGQEELDRLGLRRDAGLRGAAQDLLAHLRTMAHPCCGVPRSGLALWWHNLRHRRDNDEARRLELLLDSHDNYVRRGRWQSAGFAFVGVAVLVVALFNLLPPPESDTIRATLLAVGVLLVLMPTARSLKIGAVELQRPEVERPQFGRSKALRTSSLLQRGYQFSSFALPATPDSGRSRRDVVEADLFR